MPKGVYQHKPWGPGHAKDIRLVTEREGILGKECANPQCGWKPLDEFPKCSRKRDGKASRCLECDRAKGRAYAKAHREEAYARKRAWELANPEKLRERRQIWIKANPEKHCKPGMADVYSRTRRAKKRAVESEPFTNLEIFERDGWICGICHQSIDKNLKWPDRMSKVVDHIIPISKGGPNTRANIQAAHLSCNCVKSAKMPRNP